MVITAVAPDGLGDEARHAIFPDFGDLVSWIHRQTAWRRGLTSPLVPLGWHSVRERFVELVLVFDSLGHDLILTDRIFIARSIKIDLVAGC